MCIYTIEKFIILEISRQKIPRQGGGAAQWGGVYYPNKERIYVDKIHGNARHRNRRFKRRVTLFCFEPVGIIVL